MTAHPNRSKQTASPAANPAPVDIRLTRDALGLTQTDAAKVIHSTLRGWQSYESGERRMHPAFWELFLLKTNARAIGASP